MNTEVREPYRDRVASDNGVLVAVSADDKQVIEDVEVHEVVEQNRLAKTIDGVKSKSPKFKPVIVNCKIPVEIILTGAP